MSKHLDYALNAVSQPVARFNKWQLVRDDFGEIYRVLHVSWSMDNYLYTCESKKGIKENWAPSLICEDYLEDVVIPRPLKLFYFRVVR